MDFYLRQGSTEPILKMRVVESGRYLKNELQERIQNARITFSMKSDEKNYKIFRKPCILVPKNDNDEYFVAYLWENEDVDEKGTYEGYFEIKFLNILGEIESLLIAPVKEKLSIHII